MTDGKNMEILKSVMDVNKKLVDESGEMYIKYMELIQNADEYIKGRENVMKEVKKRSRGIA